MVLEVTESVMDAPCFQVVSYQAKVLILGVELSNDGTSICFKLGMLLVVPVVMLYFGKGGRVLEPMGHLSQGVIGSSLGLEELIKPNWHGVDGVL